MIVTDLEHALQQVALTPALRKAFDFLRQHGAEALADGRVDIDGERAYALVQSYETRVEPKFEAHRKYLDIQYMAAGEEIIGWAFIDRMIVDAAYDAAKDVCLGHVPPEDMTPVRLSAGQLAVLYPTDAHAPRLAAGTPTSVKKIVVKVAV
jgi:biofilm protein TabA